MSDLIKHECGVAMLRLLKPLEFYQEKYGSTLWGLNKMYLLMEKQHNRGQDGVGLANVKLDVETSYDKVMESLKKASENDLNGILGFTKDLVCFFYYLYVMFSPFRKKKATYKNCKKK